MIEKTNKFIIFKHMKEKYTYLQKIDKNSIEIGNLYVKEDETSYWLTKTPKERFIALEQLRERFYNYDSTTTRLQRILEIAERKRV